MTPETLRTFATNELGNSRAEHQRRMTFNKMHAAARIPVEHAFGQLQNRFPILYELPGFNLERIWNLVVSLLVLHNIIQSIDDFWDDDGERDLVDILLVQERARAQEMQQVLAQRRLDQEVAVGAGEGGAGNVATQVRVDGVAFRERILNYYVPL